MVALAVVVVSTCGCGNRTSVHDKNQTATSPPLRSGDVAALQTALAAGEKPVGLQSRFKIVDSWHSDAPDASDVGGDPRGHMWFFFSDTGSVFRIHEEKGLIELKNPVPWVKGMGESANRQED